MEFLASLTDEDIHNFHNVLTNTMEMRKHFDVFAWLQGEMQRYLPHDIMIAAWGNFHDGAIHHDIISALAGVRSKNADPETINPFLLEMFTRWKGFGNKPFSINAGDSGFILKDKGLKCELSDAMRKMRCALVHGIADERGSHNCLYMTFSLKKKFSEAERGAMSMMMPYLDMALRQVVHLPHQAQAKSNTLTYSDPRPVQAQDLTNREAEVLSWVSLGKTNPEIGSILDISSFTVKNHMQRVFKKLDVTNRAQAVGKFMTSVIND